MEKHVNVCKKKRHYFKCLHIFYSAFSCLSWKRFIFYRIEPFLILHLNHNNCLRLKQVLSQTFYTAVVSMLLHRCVSKMILKVQCVGLCSIQLNRVECISPKCFKYCITQLYKTQWKGLLLPVYVATGAHSGQTEHCWRRSTFMFL